MKVERRAAAATVALIGAAVLALSACSSANHIASKQPTDAVNQVAQAVSEQQSVTLHSVQGSQVQDVKMARRSASGTIVDGESNLEFVVVAGTAYLKGNAAWWAKSGQPGQAAKANGKWVSVNETSPLYRQFAPFMSFDRLVGTTGTNGAKVSQGTGKDIDGQSAYSITRDNGKVTLWVATKGPALPIELDNAAVNPPENTTFSNWNTTTPNSPPPASEIIPLN